MKCAEAPCNGVAESHCLKCQAYLCCACWGDPSRHICLGRVAVAVDLVNHPPHYTAGKFEVIEVLEDWFSQDPLLWQVGKYIARSPHKGNELQDLEKAAWYLARKIAKLKEGSKDVTIPQTKS